MGLDIAGADMRVLVAEDDDLIRELLGEALGEAGFEVVLAASGDEAAGLLPAGFDVLWTDVRMPGDLDGFALARRMRAARPNAPVVFASGHVRGRGDVPPDIAQPFLMMPKPYRLHAVVSLMNVLATAV